MAFFDDLSKKITDASTKTIQKGKDLTDVARLNSQISAEENRINTLYGMIGKQYMELHRKDAEDAFAGGPLLSSLGRTLGVPTPLMDAGVALASEINGVDYQRQGITLERFGLDGRTPQELNWYFEHGFLPTN